MDEREILIRIVIETEKHLTPIRRPVQSQTMPTLRLTGDAVPVDGLAKHIDGYAEWLRAKGNDPEYIRKTANNCKKVCADLGWLEPDDINEDDMIGFLARLQEQRRGAKTRNHYRDAVCGWCSWLVRKAILSRNPIELVPKARVTDQVPRAVPTEEQVQALVDAAKSDRRKKDRWLVYMIAAGTGLRKEEIRQLTVAMYRGGDSPRFELPATVTKSRKPQTVFLPDGLDRLLSEHLQGKQLPDPVVVAIPKWDSFERDRKSAGIPKVDNSGATFSFHSLRHYFCNRLAEADVDSETRRKLMRHGSLQMTEGVYTRTNANRLSKKINSASFFAVDDDDEPPIEWEADKETPMRMVTESLSGAEVQILSPRSGTETTHETTPGRDAEGGATHNTFNEGAGGADFIHPTARGFSALTPNDNRPATSVPSSLPGSLSSGSSEAAGHSDTTQSIDAMLAEAFLAGVRVGRNQAHGGK